jgi:hypothetical protein
LVVDRRATGISLTANLFAVSDVLVETQTDLAADNEPMKRWSKRRGQPSSFDAVPRSFPIVTLTV